MAESWLDSDVLAERIRRSWDATSESYCDLGHTFLLCAETGDVAMNGECPTHGGDGCLFVFGCVALLDPKVNRALSGTFTAFEDWKTLLLHELMGIALLLESPDELLRQLAAARARVLEADLRGMPGAATEYRKEADRLRNAARTRRELIAAGGIF